MFGIYARQTLHAQGRNVYDRPRTAETSIPSKSSRGLRQYERDETIGLSRIVESMNTLHARMGGRTSRPERKALIKAMAVLQKEIDAQRHWSKAS